MTDLTAGCPSCGSTSYMDAALTDDIASSLDAGGGVVTAACHTCDDRVAFQLEADQSCQPGADDTATGSTCPACGDANILGVSLSADSLSQLEEGYVLLDVSCMSCDTDYTVQTSVTSTFTA